MSAQCAKCGTACEPDDLSHSEKGLVCGSCLADEDVNAASKGRLGVAKKALIGSFVMTVACWFVTFRSSSSSSSSAGGHGSKTVTQSADYPDLILGGLAALFMIFGLYSTIRARSFDGEKDPAFTRSKLIIIVLQLLVGGLIALTIWQALPSNVTTKF